MKNNEKRYLGISYHKAIEMRFVPCRYAVKKVMVYCADNCEADISETVKFMFMLERDCEISCVRDQNLFSIHLARCALSQNELDEGHCKVNNCARKNCPIMWSQLSVTDNLLERECGVCREKVVWVDDESDLKLYSEFGLTASQYNHFPLM